MLMHRPRDRGAWSVTNWSTAFGRFYSSQLLDGAGRRPITGTSLKQGRTHHECRHDRNLSVGPKTQTTFGIMQRKRQVREISTLAFVPKRELGLECALCITFLQSTSSKKYRTLGKCTNEMLLVCMDDAEMLQLLFRAAQDKLREPVRNPVTESGWCVQNSWCRDPSL